jgi:hypothetical protein
MSDLLPLLPTYVNGNMLQKGFTHLEQFYQVTVMLQTEGVTLVEVCDYLTK